MRIFQEEIFGPVVSVTSFTDFEDAMHIANDTLYGLGAGVWSRNINTAYPRAAPSRPGGVDELLPRLPGAHAAFGGGTKGSGIGRENHLPDARALPADQEPAGQLLPAEARLLLNAHSG